MTKEKTNAPTESLAVDKMGSNNVEQIRDILFGGQMKDYDLRFSRLEEKINQEQVRLANDMNSRIESLDKFMRRELSRHAEKQQQERKERLADVHQLTSDLQGLENQLSDKLQTLDDDSRRDFSEIRETLRDEISLLQKSGREQQDVLLGSLESEADKLRVDKVSHRALSGLFSEMGMRLSGDFPLVEDD